MIQKKGELLGSVEMTDEASASTCRTTSRERITEWLDCHNAIWELAERLSATGQNWDHLSVDRIAAELANHLVPDVVLTPGAVAALVNLQQAGVAYFR